MEAESDYTVFFPPHPSQPLLEKQNCHQEDRVARDSVAGGQMIRLPSVLTQTGPYRVILNPFFSFALRHKVLDIIIALCLCVCACVCIAWEI